MIYKSSKDESISNMKKDSYGVNFSVPMDAPTVTLAHYQTEVNCTSNKGQTSVLTGMYALSKRTSLFANVEAFQNTGAAFYTPNDGYTNLRYRCRRMRRLKYWLLCWVYHRTLDRCYSMYSPLVLIRYRSRTDSFSPTQSHPSG